MGIKNLFQLIKESYPETLFEYNLSELSGIILAVDTSSILYKYIRSSEEDWILGFTMLFSTLRKHGINIVCIFDGNQVTPEKQLIRDKRKLELAKRTEKVEKAKELLVRIKESKEGCKDTSLQQEIEEFLSHVRIDKQLSNKKRLVQFVEKSQKQVVPVSLEHVKKAKEILLHMGIPFYQCKGESDGHCVWLVKSGKADGVLSEDTDMLAYGCPLLFCFKKHKLSDRKLTCINFLFLLESMNLSHEQFQDLCILLSCDYNNHTRVKGTLPNTKSTVAIGWKRALIMINHHKTLDKAKKYLTDYEKLNVEVCRRYFKGEYPITDFEIVYKPPDLDKLFSMLEKEKCEVDKVFIRSSLCPSVAKFI